MIGHKLLVSSFKSLVKAGRVAHGYLFFGPEGAGKKLFALSLANFLENDDFNYDEVSARVFNDAVLIRPNANKTIGIDAVREIRNFLYQRPNVSLRRTVIIDETEFLTTDAQNALLKITEEPPASSLLVLIARDPEVLIPTLASRLQKIYFSSLRTREMKVSPLAEKFLKVSGAERQELIKKIVEPEDFDILAFLDAVILAMANQNKMDYSLWHRVLELRKNMSNFPLNPKLQLLSL